MAIQLSDNIRVGQQKPEISKYFNGYLPYASTAEVISLIPWSERHIGLTVNVNNVEYWFKDAITGESDLILKAAAPPSYLDLTDTTDTDYTGKVGSLPMVNIAEDGLELIPTEEATLLILADTPDAYTGSAGKFVMVKATEDGIEFVAPVIPPTPLALGETSTTAYQGDRGKIAYDHSQAPHAPANMNDLAIAYAIAL